MVKQTTVFTAPCCKQVVQMGCTRIKKQRKEREKSNYDLFFPELVCEVRSRKDNTEEIPKCMWH